MSTPGFRGERLREARQSRELTQPALANLLDVSRQLISDFEGGRKSPSHETLGRISELLRFPRHYFTMAVASEQAAPVYYRSLASTTKAARQKAETQLTWAQRAVDVLADLVTLPAVNLPALDVPENPSDLASRDIEAMAMEVRKYWNLGNAPVGNVVWLLENNGVVVLRRELGNECVDAYSQWRLAGNRPFVVLGTDKHSAARSRLDAAHELAHLVLHRRVPAAVLDRKDMFALVEDQAWHFAGAFLFPATSFADECYTLTLDMFRTLKSRWKMSISAMIQRAARLDLVGKEELRRLHINLTRRGWKQREPLDDELRPEEPRLLRRVFDTVVENNLLTEMDLEMRLALNRSDLEVALGFARGELGGTQDPFKLPTSSSRPSEPSLFASQDLSPIPFRRLN